MGLKRVGVVLLVLGLCLSLFSAVVFGASSGGTDAYCEDHDPAYSISAVDIPSLGITVYDGCNAVMINPLVTGGLLLVVAGLPVGLGGILQDRSTEE